MFHLETAIAEWRQQMLAAGIHAPVPMEELENHLREEIERQTKSGAAELDAFNLAVRRIGEPGPLQPEFAKVEKTSGQRRFKISLAAGGVMLGMTLMVPGMIQLNRELLVANGRFGLLMLGWFLLVWALDSIRRIVLPKTSAEILELVQLTRAKQTLKAGVGAGTGLAGMALMMPAAVQAAREGAVGFAGLGWLVFGIALLISGGIVAFHPYKRRKA